MKFILGKKIEMTQRFREDGRVTPVTAVEAGPCLITQVKTKDKDGYLAVQIGFGRKKNISKPLRGHLKKLGNGRYLREFRLVAPGDYQPGQQITAGVFQPGDKVSVVGVSKGKGFQGVVRRHKFGGSKATHGNKDQLRMPGSIGATDAARVFKGMRMAGQMGNAQVTVNNLEIIEIDGENNLIFIKGAVPGARNSLLLIAGEGEMKLEKEEAKAAPKVNQAEGEPSGVKAKAGDQDVKKEVSTAEPTAAAAKKSQ